MTKPDPLRSVETMDPRFVLADEVAGAKIVLSTLLLCTDQATRYAVLESLKKTRESLNAEDPADELGFKRLLAVVDQFIGFLEEMQDGRYD